MIELIYGIPAFIILLIGVFALIGKGTLGGLSKGILGAIPIGNIKLWSVIFIALGLVGGAFAGAGMTYDYVVGAIGGSTASFSSDATNQDAQLSCVISKVSATTAVGITNVTAVGNTNDLNHYYVTVSNATGAGSYSINGTLDCDSGRADIRQGAVSNCYIKSDSFKSYTSTTDSNTYYIIAQTTGVSEVQGMSWKQTAYLKDSGTTNVEADTADSQETIKLVFAQDEAQQYLGFNFALPGDTVLNYLTDSQDATVDVEIVCDGVTQGILTIDKSAH